MYYWAINSSMEGYINDSLSYFDIQHLKNNTLDQLTPNINECRYKDYRKPPCSLYLNKKNCSDSYDLQERWWIIFSLKLLFILIFEVKEIYLILVN